MRPRAHRRGESRLRRRGVVHKSGARPAAGGVLRRPAEDRERDAQATGAARARAHAFGSSEEVPRAGNLAKRWLSTSHRRLSMSVRPRRQANLPQPHRGNQLRPDLIALAHPTLRLRHGVHMAHND